MVWLCVVGYVWFVMCGWLCVVGFSWGFNYSALACNMCFISKNSSPFLKIKRYSLILKNLLKLEYFDKRITRKQTYHKGGLA